MPLPIENYMSPWKDNAWIRDILAEWQLDRATGGGDASLVYRMNTYSDTSPDAALALFVSLAEHSSPEDSCELAERLEWLLHKHGVAYWDVMNELCKRVPQFRDVMANVWGAGLPKDLRRKVEMWRA